MTTLARIGPNAVLQHLPVLDAEIGGRMRGALLHRAGIAEPPADCGMLPESEVVPLHLAVWLYLPDRAPVIQTAAGRAVGDYILAHRIPRPAQALIRALPKALRRHFIPAPHFAQAATEALLEAPEAPLRSALSEALARMTGVVVPPEDWPEAALPDNLRMRFEVLAPDGRIVAAGRDLAALQAAHRGDGRIAAPAEAAPAMGGEAARWNRDHVSAWDFGPLPEGPVDIVRAGLRVPAWPALAAEGGAVALRLFDRPEAARWKSSCRSRASWACCTRRWAAGRRCERI